MAQQSLKADEVKADFSSLPRGAIGIKGFPVSRNTRLPSIRSPRDLTLGGQPKRNFVPNIPVRREKRLPTSTTEGEIPKSEIVSKNVKSAAHRNERGRGRGRGREIIQTQGSVFGEGIAASSSSQTPKEKRFESGRRTASASASASTKQSFVIKQEAEDKSMDMKDVLDTLLRDDFVEFEDENTKEIKPIIFPLPDFAKNNNKMKEEIKSRILGKDDDYAELALKIKQEKLSDKKEEKPLPDLLANDEPLLLLLQFPNCVALPQKKDDADKYSVKKERVNSEVGSSKDEKTDSKGNSLSNMSEGYVGKLQVMKSGETKLILGSLMLNVEHAIPLRTKHEVASVRTNMSGGDMTVLGHVYQKLKCIPQIDNLIPQQRIF